MGLSLVFTKGMDNLNAGQIAIGVSSFKVALLATLPSAGVQDTANVWGDVAANEASGAGYTAGGAAITLTHAINTTGGVHQAIIFGPANTQWASVTIVAAGAVIYRSDGANLYVLTLVDFGGTKTASGGTFQITWDPTNGVLKSANTPV